MIKCLLSRPGLISGPLKPKPKLILTQFQGLTLSTPSLVMIMIYTEALSGLTTVQDQDGKGVLYMYR